MVSRQKVRSEETKQAILAAAGELFTRRGYEAVTMREIARAAGCSHTAIYIYFKDKEALLHVLAMGPLEALRRQMEAVLQELAIPPEERLKQISRTFIHFCLANRNMYTILFMAKASRVDEAEPVLEVQQIRNQLFGLLRQAVADTLPRELPDDRLWAYSRIYFFTLHGMISLYADSHEPLDELMERLGPTFDLSVAVMLAGFRGVTATALPD